MFALAIILGVAACGFGMSLAQAAIAAIEDYDRKIYEAETQKNPKGILL